jgi:sugar O-acyltransferase (sialic acid O-acetyltransferase NeuD family)
LRKPTDLIVLGTGGSSLDIVDTVADINRGQSNIVYRCVGFLDDNASLWGSSLEGVEVLGPLASARRYTDCLFVNGIASTNSYRAKAALIAKTEVPTDRFATIVHPTASVSQRARIGAGSVVLQHVVVTARAAIGEHVMILPNTIVSHDVTVGDFTSVAGGVCISGGVRIGRSCYLGTNSSIRESVEIGEGSLVGMGSVVLRDVAADSVVVGIPARVVRSAKPLTADAMLTP